MPDFNEILRDLEHELSKGPMPGSVFEAWISRALNARLPYSVLSNVALYRPDLFRTDDDRGKLAYEIDNLFHYRSAEIDHIIIVETKSQFISSENGAWNVIYNGKTSNVRRQLLNHAHAIQRYLRPLDRKIELRIAAIAISSDLETKADKAVISGFAFFKLHYRSFGKFLEFLLKKQNGFRPNVLRVAQSEYLGLLRLGIPVPSLGHPEPRHAIHYIDRCRKEIDSELFRSFEPSHSRWVINGTAGMGKSVLLAYAVAVFASDKKIVEKNSRLVLEDHGPRAKELKLAPREQRTISVLAMKPKQCQVLQDLFQRFIIELNAHSLQGELPFIKPHFDTWNEHNSIAKNTNVLVVDEAHDLSPAAQATIRDWYLSDPDNRYLLLACDRHQKIRLVGTNATIIEGLNFSGHSLKLGRNYRNPFPIYATSLALMFRWFAETGPKVIPTNAQIQDCLGFDVQAQTIENMGKKLSMRSDVHPANNWSHCVGSFNNATTAFKYLRQQNLKRQEVLWARFCQEDPDFDYEQLSSFTYHNFHSNESSDLVDKYVKGQEFPIVIMEGFPDKMDQWGEWDPNSANMSAHERSMWCFRRELYICASRATAFLYFICNTVETDEIARIESELAKILNSFALPIKSNAANAGVWSFTISPSDMQRSLSVFDDLEALPQIPATEQNIRQRPRAVVSLPITSRSLAEALGLKPFKITKQLMEMKILATPNQPISPSDAHKIAHQNSFDLVVSNL